MRTIPIFLIGIGLLAACTTEPDHPRFEVDPPPPPVLACDESCDADADCGDVPDDAPAGARMACCLDGDKEGEPDVCGTSNRCLVVGATVQVPGTEPGNVGLVCQKDSDCADGQACGGGYCVACVPPPGDDPTAKSKYCTDATKPICAYDPANPVAASCGDCLSDAECLERDGNHRCAAVPVGENAAPFGTAAPTGFEFLCSCDTNASCTEPGRELCRAEGCVCSDDSGCPDTEACVDGACVACGKDSDCVAKEDDGDPLTLAKTQCVNDGTTAAACGCSDNSECEPDAAGNDTYCHELSGTCIACRRDSDCGDGAKCIAAGTPDAECACMTDAQCDDDRKCFGAGVAGAFCGCTTNDNCVADPAGPICNKDTGACQECSTNAHCKDSAGGAICDGGTCTGCVADQDCIDQKLGSVCIENSCSCAAGSECAAPKSSPELTWVCE